MTTNNDLDQAREWAKWIIQADSQVEVDPDLRGVANVIQSLPDEWFDADPAQIHAAVAEVIRLRQALEERLRVWEKVADKLAAKGDHRDELMHLVLKQVTRILEGEA